MHISERRLEETSFRVLWNEPWTITSIILVIFLFFAGLWRILQHVTQWRRDRFRQSLDDR